MVGGVVCILVAFLVLFIANLATTLCAAQQRGDPLTSPCNIRPA
jgi:hypothetical protein